MLNSIVIMGRLTDDPKFQTLPTGTNLATFTVACERDFSGKSEAKQTTDLIDVSAWRGNADFVRKHFRKGNMIVVDGRLQTRSYTDSEGKTRVSTEVNAENIYFGEPKAAKAGEEDV